MRTNALKNNAAPAPSHTPFFNKGGGWNGQQNGTHFFKKNNGQTANLQTKTAIGEPKDKQEEKAGTIGGSVVQRSAEETTGTVNEMSGTPAVQASWQFGDLFPSDKPPTDNKCHVILGGRLVDASVGYLGFRHLYINYYLNSNDYGVIEAGPVPPEKTSGGGESGAWVKPNQWEGKGIQWDITPTDCPSFINCLKTETNNYNSAKHPYHYKAPNSNSFAWWVLNQCGVNVSFLLSPWPYMGYNYWQTHSATSAVPEPAPVPAMQ